MFHYATAIKEANRYIKWVDNQIEQLKIEEVCGSETAVGEIKALEAIKTHFITCKNLFIEKANEQKGQGNEGSGTENPGT